MKRSPALQRILKKNINDKVLNDYRSDGNDRFLGEDKFTISQMILEKGRTDFRKSSLGFSAAEKVLLYSYFNMKTHIDTCECVLNKQKHVLSKLLADDLHIYDIGCGPFTVGLAFADLFKNQKFDYTCVDNSDEMLKMGSNLWQQCSKERLIGRNSNQASHNHWDYINIGTKQNKNVLFAFSYFFATKQLNDADIKSLARAVKSISRKAKGSVYLLHINSSYGPANTNYLKFMDELGFEPNLKSNNNSVYEFVKLSVRSSAVESNSDNDYNKRIEEIRKVYPNAYNKWTEEEETSLVRDFNLGITCINILSNRFSRQPSAIESRLIKLNLLDQDAA
jgi:SAM-dependent methyltransferase